VIFFCGENSPCFYFFKSPKQHGEGNFLGNSQKKLPHFEEKCFEIAKSLDDLGRFLDLKIFFCHI